MIRPIRTAISSYGMSGLVFHGPSLKVHPNFEVIAILERSKNLSSGIFPDSRVVRNYEEILEDPGIELVIVNTPDQYHFEMAKAALEAGKHVVVEKPFTRTSAEAWELIRIAEGNGKVLTAYQNRRWDGDFLTVKKVVEENLVGRLVEFESHFDRYRNFITPGTWKEEEDNFGGVLYNLGSHTVDQALVLFGMPSSVTAHLQILRTGGKVTDYFDIRLHYDGFAVILKCSYLVREEGPRYTIHGTNGSFLKWGIDPQEEMLKAGNFPLGPGWGKEPESQWGLLNTEINGLHYRGKIETIAGNYNSFYSNLYEVIRHGAEPAVKPEQAAHAIEILEASIKSNQTGKTIKIN